MRCVACFLHYIAGPWEWADSRRHFDLQTIINIYASQGAHAYSSGDCNWFDAAVAQLMKRSCEVLDTALLVQPGCHRLLIAEGVLEMSLACTPCYAYAQQLVLCQKTYTSAPRLQPARHG